MKMTTRIRPSVSWKPKPWSTRPIVDLGQEERQQEEDADAQDQRHEQHPAHRHLIALAEARIVGSGGAGWELPTSGSE